MAWFTDPDIFKELEKKKRQGLNIQIVIDDNDKNRNEKARNHHWVDIFHNKYHLNNHYKI